jgi:4-hydroxy-tetrahydrodipicolinate reductase
MTKVIIVGACGKMSSAVVSSLANEKDIKIIGGIESAGHPLIGQPIGKGFIQANLPSIIKDADVIVEFAIPEITSDNLKIAAQAKIPYIIGTTGYKDIAYIKNYAKKIPILMSANFSIGINLMFQLTKTATKTLKDFDIEIVEAHHKMKRDAPSGTAKKLAEIIKEVRSKRQDQLEINNEKNTPTSNLMRNATVGRFLTGQEIKIHSIRAGDIVGEHNVMFIGNGERIELIHRATSRNAFASGVIKAIRFIINQKPGLYGVEDLISF